MTSLLEKFQSRKLITLLSRFSKSELKELDLFFDSNFSKLANKEKELFRGLSLAHPFETKEQLKRLTDAIAKLPKMSPKQINKSFWAITQAVEKWMVFNELNQSEVLHQELLMQAYSKKSLADVFCKTANDALEQIDDLPTRGPQFFLQKFKINTELFYHPDTSKYSQRVESLEEMEKHLDDFYTATKLRLYCQRLSRRQFIASELPSAFQEEVLAQAQKQASQPFFQLYLQLIALFQNHDDQQLRSLIEEFKVQLPIFSKRERAIFVHLIINHLIHLINTGQHHYFHLKFEVYKLATQHDLIVFNQRITFASFINIILTACYVKQFPFANKFLKTNEAYLPKDIREDVVRLSQSHINFQKGQYPKVQQLLANAAFGSLEFKLLGKALLLRCYYEVFRKDENHRSLLLSHAHNFVRFLKSNKTISKGKKQVYLRFVQLIRELVRAKNKASSERFRKRQQLNAQVQPPDFKIISKSWLLQKIQQL